MRQLPQHKLTSMRSAIVAVMVVCSVLCLSSCRHRPFSIFSSSQQDTTELIDIFTIQRKAIEAENELVAIVKADSTHRWVQHEHGWWYRYPHKSDEHVELYSYYSKKDTCHLIRETVYSLEGDFLLDAIREFNPHEGEPFSYQLMLREMVPGDTVIMLIPWNLGYGTNGNTFIRPFMNMRTQLTMHVSPYADVEVAEDTVTNNGL